MPTDPTVPQTTPWRQGWDAAHDFAVLVNGAPSLEDNPYPEGTAEHDQWDTGYRAGWFDEYPEEANAR